MTNWFAAMAQAIAGSGVVPRALSPDPDAARRLIRTIAAEARTGPPQPDRALRAHTVRLMWTNHHLDAARRLQAIVAEPARTASSAPSDQTTTRLLSLGTRRAPDDAAPEVSSASQPTTGGPATGRGGR